MASTPTSTHYKWGILGGFIGAVLMVLLMLAAGTSMDMPQAVLLRALGVGVLGIAPADFTGTMLGGLAIHLINGTFIIAPILAAVTLAVKRQLLVTDAKRGLWIGLLAGAVVYFVFGLPMLYLVMAPAAVKAVAFTMQLANGMTPAQAMPTVKAMLMSKIGYVAVAFFFAHLLYGASWGVLTGLGVSRASGGSSGRGAAAKMPQQFKCPACGATFATQQELMDHKSKAHLM
jgi:C2H2-type zinc finger